MIGIVNVVIGPHNSKVYSFTEKYFKDYASKVGAKHIIIDTIKINIRSANLEKFQMREMFNKYDRLLYVDVDILIHPNSPNIFDIVPEDAIGGVYDNPYNLKESPHREREIKNSQLVLGNIGWEKEYINTGVMLLSKIHKDVFTNPGNRLKITSRFHDQTIINYNIQKNKFKIHSLDSKWNGMDINGYTILDKNPYSEHSIGKNKTEAYFMHFAGAVGKVKQIRKVIECLG